MLDSTFGKGADPFRVAEAVDCADDLDPICSRCGEPCQDPMCEACREATEQEIRAEMARRAREAGLEVALYTVNAVNFVGQSVFGR